MRLVGSESLNKYVSELKNLSLNMQIWQQPQQYTPDKLVCVLKLEQIQKRLLSKNNLSYSKAVEIAVAMEMAERDACKLRQRLQDLYQINAYLRKSHTGFVF